MTFDISFLKKAMDKVRNEPAFKPTKQATYCNIATYKLCCDLGLPPFFWDEGNKRPFLANDCVVACEVNPQLFSKFTDHSRAWDLAKQGYLIFAARADHPHGHIAPVYPSDGLVYSNKWKSNVPVLSNVGVRNEIIGCNYAFSSPPTYYLVI